MNLAFHATKRRNRIGFYSSVSHVEKSMGSGCHEAET